MAFAVPIKNKHILEVTERFINLFETKSGEKVMTFRHDGEGEYVSKEMDNVYAKHGIIPEVTPKEKSAMNGLAERLTRELTENTRTNLQMANLPLRFWVEALQYSVYVYNRTAHSLTGTIPYVVFTGKDNNLARLRAFGCRVYAQVPKTKRNKMEKVSQEGIFIGYATMGYHIYLPHQNRIILSSDCIFDETLFPGVEYCERSQGVEDQRLDLTPLEDIIQEYHSSQAMNENPLCYPTSKPKPTEVDENTTITQEPSQTKLQNQYSCEDDTFHTALDEREKIPQEIVPVSQPRRSTREIKGKKPLRFYFNVNFDRPLTMLIAGLEKAPPIPNSFEEAWKSPPWREAIENELSRCVERDVWTIIDDLPKGQKPLKHR